MNILICPDSFKECMDATDVAWYIQKGISKLSPEESFKILPMADGGEGTVRAMVDATGGRIESTMVHDPLMKRIDAQYGILGDGKTAVVEMAAASGLGLIKNGDRNPLYTTTYGTGELIKAALDKGCTSIILGIGGSATVDGGVGMVRALGGSFQDKAGLEIPEGGGDLDKLVKIDLNGLDRRLHHCRIIAACDVTNPLTGPNGAAFVYGPQKGATPEVVARLDANLKHLASIIRHALHVQVEQLSGGGAAGGLGAGIVAFLNGSLKPGFELISHVVHLKKWIRWADLIITGEGKMDSQTSFGKTPAGVAGLAKESNKPVIAVTGSVDGEAAQFEQIGLNIVLPIADKPMTAAQSIKEAGRLLENTAERMMSLIRLAKQI
jgi:glycerate kinase